MTMPTLPLSRLLVGDSRAEPRVGTRAPMSSSPIRLARTSVVSAIGVSVDPEYGWPVTLVTVDAGPFCTTRSEEHTSELQSRSDLVCRLLLEKKKKNMTTYKPATI